MSPRPDVSEERKNQILNAAENVFTRKGLDEARMQDIAVETGLSKGTLYLYFKSKEDLVIAILDRIFGGLFKQLKTRQDDNTSAIEAIWSFTDEAVNDFKIMLRMMPIAYEFMGLAFRNTIVQKALKRYFNFYMDALIPIIQRGIESGEFRRVDPTEVALAAGAIFEGTILLWVYDRSRVDPEKHIRSSIKLLLEGVQTRS
ncbi:MAG: TetR/AcrR family transcriptional regulator [Chloroflexota bacterium]